MLMQWLESQKANAELLADSRSVRQLVYDLLSQTSSLAGGQPAAGGEDPRALHKELERQLAPLISSQDYIGYFVSDRSGRILSGSEQSLIGQRVLEYSEFLTQCLEGKSVVTPPRESIILLPQEDGRMRGERPVIYACAPIRDEDLQVVAALSLQMYADREFTDILQLGRMGASGETYAFNKSGVMVSNSRFDDDLILLGLIPDRPGSQSIMNIDVRDPGGNMLEGFRSGVRRSELPLTEMAALAIAGNPGVNVEGYRDYRGVPVVGAWVWLSDYDLGVVTEVDVAQAFRPLMILRGVFAALFGLLVVCALAILAFTIVVARLQRDARKAAVEARRLGQYTLDEQIGAGAMGIVYRGHHAMLRRPAAIKMLDLDKVNESTLERFEREVQITCQLNHPNTIAIYDYGRTPEGVFYYAMEFIQGIDLQTLVEQYGAQPASRVIHILMQICGSLYEAHSQGLVHRDVKPANTMLAYRGCQPDVVKVLDFGLVRAASGEHATESNPGALTGTPLYMSPEAIQSPISVDARSDLYAVGAVGYFLLTGRPVFDVKNIAELCRKHVDEDPVAPSTLTSQPISNQLEHAILACLEKVRSKRPQTARDLAQLLEQAPEAHVWSYAEGDAWWRTHERGLRQRTREPSGPSPTQARIDQTIDHSH